jgi:hypothetical protein
MNDRATGEIDGPDLRSRIPESIHPPSIPQTMWAIGEQTRTSTLRQKWGTADFIARNRANDHAGVMIANRADTSRSILRNPVGNNAVRVHSRRKS